MKKRIAYVVILVIAIGLMIFRFTKVFGYKYDDGIYDLEAFYKLPDNSVDVLCLGTSHVFCGVNPTVFWQEAGITEYNLAGGFATMWDNYYVLKEALKHQAPKVVILDAYYLIFEGEHEDAATIIKNIFGIKSLDIKNDAKKAAFSNEQQDSYAYDFFSYHTRYDSLAREDFLAYKGNHIFYENCLGFYPKTNVCAFDGTYGENNGDCRDIPAKSEEYYRKIIELCQENNIELIVTVAPYFDYSEHYNGIYNSAAKIAAENNVPFVNFNTQTNLDIYTSSDFSDPAHLNLAGSKKYTRHLIELLASYSLPNHLEDNAKTYDRWRNSCEYMDRLEAGSVLKYFDRIEVYSAYLDMLPEGYLVFFNQKGLMYHSTGVEKFFSIVNVPIEYTRNHAWVYDSTTRQTTELTETDAGYYYLKKFGQTEIAIDADGFFVNGKDCEKNDYKNNVMVFDVKLESVVDSMYFEDEMLFR